MFINIIATILLIGAIGIMLYLLHIIDSLIVKIALGICILLIIALIVDVICGVIAGLKALCYLLIIILALFFWLSGIWLWL